MPTSDWGEWLPRAVAAADPNEVALWYLGCNGFVLKNRDGDIVFIDPYLGTGDPPRTVRMIPVPFDPSDVGAADALLVTHEHTDHLHGPSQAPILAGTGATCYAPPASMEAIGEADWSDRWSVGQDQFASVEPGDRFDVGSFTVRVRDAFDPDAEDPVAYVIEYRDTTIFHGGDTRPTAAFAGIAEEFDVDLGIVAFGAVANIYDREHEERSRTRWYCDENDVVEIANAIEIDRLLPSHWDMWKGMTVDPKTLHHHTRSWPYPERLELVEIGDRVDL